jgi:hypothetical protein
MALVREGEKPFVPFDGWTFLDYINNPMGKILVSAGAPSFVPYMLRLHDLDAYNRLLGMGVEILVADAGPERIGELVSKSDARFHDPYTGKPMAWDAGTRQLSFKPSNGLANRKPFNMDKGRLYLRL